MPRSSRLADGYTSTTRSPAAIERPAISVSFVARRVNCMTGLTHRRSSSIAAGNIEVSARSRSS